MNNGEGAIYYHGSDAQIASIHAGTEMGIYVTAERTAAASYGPTLTTLTLDHAATLATVADITDAVEAVRWIDEDAGVSSFDPADYETWGLLEMTEVRDHLAAAGFDGAEFWDVTPDGDDHTAVVIWNTDVLAITA